MSRIGLHRDELVRTAMRLFRRQGYASTGLQQILTEAGVPKGSLYHHFRGGKEALGEAAVMLAGELMADTLERLAEQHRHEPKAFVAAYCRVMADWMEESGFRSGCPIATTMLETVPESPALTEAGNRVLDRWTDIVTGVFVASGGTRRQAAKRAQALIAAVEGGLLLARIRQSAEPLLDVATAFDWE